MKNNIFHKTNLAVCLMFFSAIALLPFPQTAFSQTVDDCIECHMDRTLTKTDPAGTVHSLYVDKEMYLLSVHAEMEYTCVDCHEDVKAETHPSDGIPDVKCADCHEDVAAEHEKSMHGQLLKSGNADAPQCYDCHTVHGVLYPDNPKSSTHPDNLSTTCGGCHKDEAAPVVCTSVLDFVKGKQSSVLENQTILSILGTMAVRVKGHGKVSASCNFSTKRCGDCHFEAINHGNEELKPQHCAGCHTMDRVSLLFGKIHKSGLFKGPLFAVMILALYAAGIAFVIFFLKGGLARKKTGTQEDKGASEA